MDGVDQVADGQIFLEGEIVQTMISEENIV